VSPLDQHHSRAAELADELRSARARVVTTQAVLLEIGNTLAKQRYRAAGVLSLLSLRQDPAVEVVQLSPDLYDEAFELYRARADKEWGLVDCVSFVVMANRGLTEALTSDEHFEQAGFIALLRS
jgi:predicted nucleic acid-binding protein